MESFTYTNIFDTKGMEYLAIIAFLLLLIPFWIILNKQVTIREQIRHAWGALTTGILRIPLGLYYSSNHTWAHLKRSGDVSIGLDDLLIHITGGMTFRNLKNPGEEIKKGDLLAEFIQEGKQLRVYAPISGKIVNVNRSLFDNPEIIYEDPYGKGWLFQVQPTNWKADTASCHVADGTKEWFGRELDRFRDFLAVSMKKHSVGNNMVVLQDGGELIDRSLSGLPGELWQDFQKEFLDPDPRKGE